MDLVAELADDPGRWCAIQCKFYAEGYRLQRSDIDGFLAASARAPFAALRMTVTGLKSGTQYTAKAIAANGGKKTSPGTIVSLTTKR